MTSEELEELEREAFAPIEEAVAEGERRALLADLIDAMSDAGWHDAETVVTRKYDEVVQLQEISGLPTDTDTVIGALRRWLMPGHVQ